MIILVLSVMTSCGSFFASEELKIKSISSELLEDGSTRVTISYTDPEAEPHVFDIPKSAAGEPGRDGNGISEITYNHNETTGKTNVTISFTDTSMLPVSFSVPDGVSIIGFEDGYDPSTGEKYLVFKYSNGNNSEPLFLPKGDNGKDGVDGKDGKDGVDGNGIKNYTILPQADKSTVLSLELDDGRICEINIPAPERGTGVEKMLSRTESDGYYIDVFYDNGTSETLFFERSNTWLSNSGSPSQMDGIDGDYYFDVSHKVIYTKWRNDWIPIVNFEESVIKYTVQFDLNDDGDAHLNGDYMFVIDKGEYFYSSGYNVPVPTRDGYTFLGWYTVKTSDPDPTRGAFTDITPVMTNLKLYAAWEKNK